MWIFHVSLRTDWNLCDISNPRINIEFQSLWIYWIKTLLNGPVQCIPSWASVYKGGFKTQSPSYLKHYVMRRSPCHNKESFHILSMIKGKEMQRSEICATVICKLSQQNGGGGLFKLSMWARGRDDSTDRFLGSQPPGTTFQNVYWIY